MSYIRNPRLSYMWESDGDAPWCKFKAADGTLHDTGNAADKHDNELKQNPWKPVTASREPSDGDKSTVGTMD